MKTAVITGATSGIGKVTALEIAKQGYTTVLVARNEEKLKTSKQELIKSSGNENISYFIADLSLINDIKKVVEEIKQAHPVIDVLVNNAGAMFSERQETNEGVELTFATNHINYFLFTKLLLENIKAAPKARITGVSSEAQKMTKTVNWDDIEFKNNFKGLKAYAQSKLFNAMFTFKLADKLKDTNITVNCMHPGGVNTSFGRNTKGFMRFLVGLIFPLMRTPEKGAETLVWLATSDEVEGVSGKYFYDKKSIQASPPAYNDVELEKLWQLTEDIVAKH
ncbi:MAG: SDR family oxidoreductase [bacterium]